MKKTMRYTFESQSELFNVLCMSKDIITDVLTHIDYYIQVDMEQIIYVQ